MRKVIFISLISILVLAGTCVAQTSKATIQGFVSDTSGAVVPNVSVVLTNESTGAVQRAMTSSNGSYVLPSLPPGRYSITVSLKGFTKFVQSDIHLEVNQQLRLDAVLHPGAVTQTVTVSAVPTQVETRSGALSEVVGHTEMIELPLNGRNVLDLMKLQAGVVATGGVYIQAYSQVSTGYNISGGRGNAVNFMLNGGTNVDLYSNVSAGTPDPDAVEEFSVQKSGYEAEFGGAGGAVSLITPSGTNLLHGVIYDYLRNGALNARNFFSPVQDKLTRNQYGFSIGGPVYIPKYYDGRNRTFFFFNYQNTRINSSSSSGSVDTPTALERAGDLSSISKPVIDPLTGQPFPGNHIPANRLDPAMQKFLQQEVGLPGPNGRFHFTTAVGTFSAPQYSLRFDENPREKDRMYVAYFHTLTNSSSPGTPGNIFDPGGGTEFYTGNLSFNETHLFSPSVVNTAQFTWLDRSHQFLAGQSTSSFKWSNFGVNFQPTARSPHGGFYNALFSATLPLVGHAWGNTFDWSDTLAWVRGRHELKFGGDVNDDRDHFMENFITGGRFIFGAGFTGSGVGDLVLGLPVQFRLLNPNVSDSNRPLFAYYAQDKFQANRRLTLTYGLRWEPFENWKETRNQVVYWAPGRHSTRFPNMPTNLLTAGDPGVPVRGQASELARFAPRFGFAYDPEGNGKWAVRGAYGVFLDTAWVPAETGNVTSGPPFNLATLIVNPVSFSNPFEGHANPYPAPVPAPPSTVYPLPLGGIALYQPNLENPYMQNWNLTLEHQLPSNILVRASYVGSKGTHLDRSTALNPAVFIPGTGLDGKPLSTVANTQSRRLFPDFTSIDMGTSDGSSIYHGLQMSIERPFYRNLQLKINYTYSKTIDNGIQAFGPAGGDDVRDPFNPGLDRGRSDFDIRHVFVASFVDHPWDPKSGNRFLKDVLGNWVTSGIITAQSGGPFTVRSGFDNSLSGVGLDTPDVIGNPNAPSGAPERRLGWFNTKAFVPNALGTFGTAGRNILSGPGLFDIDFGLYKDIPFTRREGTYVEFRAEFFNLLNHTNFGGPVATLTSPSFGKIFSAGSPRIIQFALRVNF